ncbi:hypothetical protein GCM10027589_20210 [Actinocorallia lasiicapitis]
MRPLVQLALGLSVGTAVPLAVVGVLLLTREAEVDTFDVTPASVPEQRTGGLRADQGSDLLPYLIAAKDLPKPWKPQPQPAGVKPGNGTMKNAPYGIPDTRPTCARESLALEAFFASGPYAYANFTDGKARSVGERVLLFRPGVGEEAMVYLKGFHKRCPKVTGVWSGATGNGSYTYRYSTRNVPGLGDGAVQVRSTYTSGPFSFRQARLYIRFGDTFLLLYSGNSGAIPRVIVDRAVAKLGL